MSTTTATAAPSEDPRQESLITASQRQLRLPGLPTEEDWQASEAPTEYQAGEYTGERLFLRAPKVYQACIELLAASVPVRTICNLLHVNCQTVAGVREREPEAIGTAKARLSARLMNLGHLQTEIVRDQLCNLLQSGKTLKPGEIKDLLIGLGITLDKGMLLAGEATSRMEVVARPAPGHDDFNRFIEAQAVEVDSTGYGEGTPAAKGPLGEGGQADPAGLPAGARAQSGEPKALPATTGQEPNKHTEQEASDV